MALRTFADSEGHDWRAFDVVPRALERRSYDRRNMGQAALRFEERRDADRRVSVGRLSALAGVSAGWLCFEPAEGRERRRLMPIPDDWRLCSAEKLDVYRRAARVVPESASLGELASRDRHA